MAQNKKAAAFVFQRYFLTVLLLLVLPAATLFLLLIHTTTKEFTDYMKQNEVQQLHLLEQTLAAEFYNDSEIVKSLQIYQNIRPFYLQNSPSSASNLIRDLNNHFTNNNIVDEIFMHFFCDEYFYSTQTSYSLRSFMNQFNLPYGEGGRGTEFLRRMERAQSAEDVFYLRSVEPKQSVSKSEPSRAILYVYPYEVDGIVAGSVIFQINEENLNSWIGNSEGRDTYIFNAEKELLNVSDFSGAAVQRLGEEWINARVEETLRGASLELNRKGYYVLSGAISNTGLYYMRLVENDTLFSSLQKIQCIYLVLLLLLLVCGSGAIALLSKPLRKLQSALTGKAKTTLNVVDTFLDSYNHLQETNLQFRDEATTSAREKFLLELLNRETKDEEQIAAKGEAFGVPLYAPYHFVVIGRQGFESEEAVRAAFAFGERFLYLIPVRELSSLVSWIVGTERFLARKSLQKADIPGQLSTGSCHAGWGHIHDSYVEAHSYWDISSAPQQYYKQMELSIDFYYKEQLRLACEQLAAGEVERFATAVQGMNAKMAAQGVPQDIQCQIWVKLIFTVDKVLREAMPENEPEPQDPSALVLNEDPGVLFAFLCSETEKLRQYKKEREPLPPPPLTVEAVLQFINENYTDENFSLQLLADHFGISLSYLSLFFKERRNENLLDYYTGLRMKKARELLDHAGLPLKEVVRAVGYSNTSSFIRRFKQLYGVTPGEYKKAAGKPAESAEREAADEPRPAKEEKAAR